MASLPQMASIESKTASLTKSSPRARAPSPRPTGEIIAKIKHKLDECKDMFALHDLQHESEKVAAENSFSDEEVNALESMFTAKTKFLKEEHDKFSPPPSAAAAAAAVASSSVNPFLQIIQSRISQDREDSFKQQLREKDEEIAKLKAQVLELSKDREKLTYFLQLADAVRSMSAAGMK